jgi:aminopeptidase N
MIAVGPFAVVKDRWKNMEVSYYVDKEYEPYARDIFGSTPEMLQLFSDRLGVPYPWPKYAQVSVRDFVTGAMENVSATTHGGFIQQTRRQLIDGNEEAIIAHELFHQWFGDLVTTESWSNITLNESFADYGPYLWFEHKYGPDAADLDRYQNLQSYLRNPENTANALVRYYYQSPDDLFDAVSYSKGACILHMLRAEVGDDAFFASLKEYLTTHRYRSAEVADLRLAFEKVTGRDLNWFFNQWYFAPGHPVLNITTNYDDSARSASITVEQIQNTDEGTPVYRLPVAIDVYAAGNVTRHRAVYEGKKMTVALPCESMPELINFDAEKVLVCKKTENKTDSAFAFQYQQARKFMDRLEALQYFSRNPGNPLATVVFEEALNDPFWYLRQASLNNVKEPALRNNEMLKYKIASLANSDPKSSVRIAAIKCLAALNDSESKSILEQAVKDSSYLVISEALNLILKTDTQRAYELAQLFEAEESNDLKAVIGGIYAYTADASKMDFFNRSIRKADRRNRYDLLDSYGLYLTRLLPDVNAIAGGLPLLYYFAEQDQTWWIRMKSMMALQTVQQALEDRMAALEKNPAGDNYDLLQLMSLRLEELNQNMAAIKERERDERLLGIYNR